MRALLPVIISTFFVKNIKKTKFLIYLQLPFDVKYIISVSWYSYQTEDILVYCFMFSKLGVGFFPNIQDIFLILFFSLYYLIKWYFWFDVDLPIIKTFLESNLAMHDRKQKRNSNILPVTTVTLSIRSKNYWLPVSPTKANILTTLIIWKLACNLIFI